MAELKTKKSEASPSAFLGRIQDEEQRDDAIRVAKLMQAATKQKPRMWGSSIVGFGAYRCRYPNGRELDWFKVGFSPRKGTLVLYLMTGFAPYAPLMKSLGKHKTGKSCLYIKRLADVDLPTLRKLIQQSVAQVTKSASGAA